MAQTNISDLEQNDCEYLKHWLGEDEKAFSSAKDFFHQAKKELKRSFVLTKTQAANPRWLGVKPRKTKYSAKAYPTLPATLEESVESGPSRTETWVNNAKQNTGKELKDGVKTEKCPKDDANGKPPD